MKFKNTFYNWLTNRFILIIRSEENFAIKGTFSYNYAKLIVAGIFAVLLIFILSVYLVHTALARWFNPRYTQLQTARKIIVLSSKVDSLEFELERRDDYINHFKALISGEITENADEIPKNENQTSLASVNIDEITPEDSLLRRKVEKEVMSGLASARKKETFEGVVFYPPVEGVIKQRFDLKKNFKGIAISPAQSESVKTILDGLVIHRKEIGGINELIVHSIQYNLIFKYYFKGEVVAREGERVRGGEVLGMPGPGKDSEVYIETLYEGFPINPEYFVKF